MAKVMTLDELIAIAAGAGIKLEPDVDEHRENLYVYTDPNGDVLYIGSSASAKRGRDEKRIAGEGYTDRIGVGFSALITENNGVRHSFHYDPKNFDPAPLLRQIEKEDWKGDSVDDLKKQITPGTFSVAQVEHILVRIPVCTGRLIGNSQYASQWEAGVYHIPNVVAVIAADIARETARLPKNTTIDTEGEAAKA